MAILLCSGPLRLDTRCTLEFNVFRAGHSPKCNIMAWIGRTLCLSDRLSLSALNWLQTLSGTEGWSCCSQFQSRMTLSRRTQRLIVPLSRFASRSSWILQECIYVYKQISMRSYWYECELRCVLFPEKWITECGPKMIYELLPNKEVLYVVPVTSILRKLPVVKPGDTGTVPHKQNVPAAASTRQQPPPQSSSPGSVRGFALARLQRNYHYTSLLHHYYIVTTQYYIFLFHYFIKVTSSFLHNE